MIKVWILIFYIEGTRAAGSGVVDNLASLADCQRIAASIKGIEYGAQSRCVQVWKVKP